MPKKVDLSVETLLDLAERNLTQAEMSEITGVSIPTLQKRLADLQEKQGLLLKARDLRNLRLTELQMMVLDAMTPEKIAAADIKDLAVVFKVLADRENVDIGKPTEIKGLVSYLVQIEKEQVAMKTIGSTTISQSVIGTDDDVAILTTEDLEGLPKL
jgi:transcriptional regulator with XRE-family HTH domain